MTPPKPTFSDFERPHFEALRDGRVVFEKCDECSAFRAPGRPVCPECLSESATWTEVSGRGEVHTFTWFFGNLDPGEPPYSFTEFPYNVAIVELDEGPRVVTNIDNVMFGELAVGDPVRVHVVETADRWALLHFTPDAR